MATTVASRSAEVATSPRPEARWVTAVDESGRSRLVMRWSVPDPDAALRAVLAEVR